MVQQQIYFRQVGLKFLLRKSFKLIAKPGQLSAESCFILKIMIAVQDLQPV